MNIYIILICIRRAMKEMELNILESLTWHTFFSCFMCIGTSMKLFFVFSSKTPNFMIHNFYDVNFENDCPLHSMAILCGRSNRNSHNNKTRNENLVTLTYVTVKTILALSFQRYKVLFYFKATSEGSTTS